MARLFGGLDLPGNLQPWGVAAAGPVLCLAALVLGRRLFVRAPAATPPTEPAAPPPPAPDPFEFGSSSEKRAALRRKGAFVEVLVTDKAQQHPWSAWVLD